MMPLDLTKRLAQRSAIVTGAASGNGLAIGTRLLAEGASVLFVDRDADLLDEVTPTHERASKMVADITDTSQVADMVEAAAAQFGGLDILVNNAGIVRFSEFDDLGLEEWEEVIRVNATGAFIVTKAAVPLIRDSVSKREGTAGIVNVTSIEAHLVIASAGHPQVHYNASKGALHMLNQALALELAPRIRVNAIAPGIVETPFTARALHNPQLKSFYLERIPLDRVAQPSDVAASAAFLASEDASYITGATIFVDGGWMVQ